jgi:hypothetical protein
MFNYALNTSYSDAACSVEVNPLRGTATVWFWQGGPYTYRKVSRRALCKAIAEDFVMGGLPSVGQWVNRTLLAA